MLTNVPNGSSLMSALLQVTFLIERRPAERLWILQCAAWSGLSHAIGRDDR
jgi:hypothetical protein